MFSTPLALPCSLTETARGSLRSITKNSGLLHNIARSGESVQEVPRWAVFSINQCRCRNSATLAARYPVPISARRNDRKLCQDQHERSGAGCAITIGWDAGEAWRLILTESTIAVSMRRFRPNYKTSMT